MLQVQAETNPFGPDVIPLLDKITCIYRALNLDINRIADFMKKTGELVNGGYSQSCVDSVKYFISMSHTVCGTLHFLYV